MKVIIAGSRNIKDPVLISKAIRESRFEITEVVSGGARGVDKLAEIWAQFKNLPLKVFQPNWDKYKLAAGPMRNKEMAKYAEALIAIWDGKSRGTDNMIREAYANKLKVYVKIVDPSSVKKEP